MMKNRIEYKVWGRDALFTDPTTRVGGEKFSYFVPTYEALKGVTESIYWKPTITWIIDAVRIMNPIRQQSKGVKPLIYSGGNTLSIYNYLMNVEYQVRAHFEWNLERPDLEKDRIDGKHWEIAQRSLEKGGRYPVFLGTNECQAYVEPCVFGSEIGAYDNKNLKLELLMFHSFEYQNNVPKTSFWFIPKIVNGVITFPQQKCCFRKDCK